jgi:hypothetical protein
VGLADACREHLSVTELELLESAQGKSSNFIQLEKPARRFAVDIFPGSSRES